MKFITGKDRNQTEFFCLEQAIAQDNEVRLIDLFVSSIKMKDYGFNMDFIDNGRPAYHPSELLKVFIYGYLNRIRSSRQLEKECRRNIELMWLMRGLAPDHNTIANFRKDNPKAIRKIFHVTVSLAKNFELIGGKLLAGDSTKLRAQNSKKNNFNAAKIERHIAYIDDKLSQYSTMLAQQDQDLRQENKAEIQNKVTKHKQQRNKYETYKKYLDETGEVQISTSDPDSRQLITRNNITEVAYNVQTTVDAKHNIPIDFKVTNQNDSKAMGGMVRRAKTIIGSALPSCMTKDTIPEQSSSMQSGKVYKSWWLFLKSHLMPLIWLLMWQILTMTKCLTNTFVLPEKASLQMGDGTSRSTVRPPTG